MQIGRPRPRLRGSGRADVAAGRQVNAALRTCRRPFRPPPARSTMRRCAGPRTRAPTGRWRGPSCPARTRRARPGSVSWASACPYAGPRSRRSRDEGAVEEFAASGLAVGRAVAGREVPIDGGGLHLVDIGASEGLGEAQGLVGAGLVSVGGGGGAGGIARRIGVERGRIGALDAFPRVAVGFAVVGEGGLVGGDARVGRDGVDVDAAVIAFPGVAVALGIGRIAGGARSGQVRSRVQIAIRPVDTHPRPPWCSTPDL